MKLGEKFSCNADGGVSLPCEGKAQLCIQEVSVSRGSTKHKPQCGQNKEVIGTK